MFKPKLTKILAGFTATLDQLKTLHAVNKEEADRLASLAATMVATSNELVQENVRVSGIEENIRKLIEV